DELVDVRIAGVVADVLALEPRPRRRRDDLARLGDNVAEADLLLFLAFSQMNVIAPGRLGKFRPRLYRNLAVGFRGQHEYSLAGIDIGLDPGPACRRSVGDHAVELCKQFDLMPGVPGDALRPVAELLQIGPERGVAGVGCRVIALDDRHVAHRLAGHRIAFALLP